MKSHGAMLKRMCYPGLALFCGIFCLRGWVPLPLLLQIHSVHSPRTSHYIRSWELDQALLWQKWLLLVFGRGGGLLQQGQLQLAKHAFGCSQVELSYLQAGPDSVWADDLRCKPHPYATTLERATRKRSTGSTAFLEQNCQAYRFKKGKPQSLLDAYFSKPVWSIEIVK